MTFSFAVRIIPCLSDNGLLLPPFFLIFEKKPLRDFMLHFYERINDDDDDEMLIRLSIFQAGVFAVPFS